MFELRKLKSEDLFTMFSILSKIGFKDLKELITQDKIKEVTALISTNGNGENADATTMFGMSVVMDVVSLVMKNLPSCKNEIYTLLSDLSGMKVKQIADLDMVEFTEMVVAVIQKEEFKDFFKVVSRLFK
ncbi:MAG: hypothetical protein Q4F03_04925 [Eubacteriales bacterium]|nr:hypothetical protein [Eubacteriales bacterium]